MREHIDRFLKRGLAFDDLFDEIEIFRAKFELPTCAISFQLPYPLDINFTDYAAKGDGSDIEIHLRFIPSFTEVDERAQRITHRKSTFEGKILSRSELRECTQCIALTPLRGSRQQYYDKYIALSQRGLEEGIVIPREQKPYIYDLSGAITVRMFELEMARMAILQTTVAMKRFLRDYMAISLHEVEIPNLLYSTIASPREERYFPLGDSPDMLVALLRKTRSGALRRVSEEGMKRAAEWPARSFSPFEGQILALKRLADDGEPELAIIGLIALVEWLLKDNLPQSNRKLNPRYNTAFDLFKYAEIQFPMQEETWAILQSARKLRNSHVHEKPTVRSRSYDPASVRYANTGTAEVFNDSALAAFELFRTINFSRSAESEERKKAVIEGSQAVSLRSRFRRND